MQHFLRLRLQDIFTRLSVKSQWTRNEEELEELLYRYVSIGQTTLERTKVFLNKHRIPFQQETPPFRKFSAFADNQRNTDCIVFFTLSGPTQWDGFVPFGSKYHIAFLFQNSVLNSIEVGLLEFHF